MVMEIPPREWQKSLCIGCKAVFLDVYIQTFLSVKYTAPPPPELTTLRTTLWEFNAV